MFQFQGQVCLPCLALHIFLLKSCVDVTAWDRARFSINCIRYEVVVSPTVAIFNRRKKSRSERMPRWLRHRQKPKCKNWRGRIVIWSNMCWHYKEKCMEHGWQPNILIKSWLAGTSSMYIYISSMLYSKQHHGYLISCTNKPYYGSLCEAGAMKGCHTVFAARVR